MSRHDYTKHSKKNQNEVTKAAKAAEVIEELESEVVEPIEDPVENVEIKEDKVEYDTATVVNCIRLRVRSEPRLGDNVICEISQGTTVMIDKSKSTSDYYKIYTEAGVEGYCQKPYIA